jgi:hypothetical protein
VSTLPVKTRVLIFFASNPDMKMTTEEMCKKFDIRRQTLLAECDAMEEAGLITLARLPRLGAPGTTPLGWAAGPTLLEEL